MSGTGGSTRHPQVGPRPARPTAARFGAAPSRGTAAVVLVVVGVVFAVPIAALLQFTFRQGTSGTLTTAHYAAIADPVNRATYQPVFDGLGASLAIALITVGIVLLVLLPAQVITALRYPRLRRLLEFVCIVPITVPAVVLVVGLVPVYQVVSRLLGSGAWTLAFAVGIVALPFAFRPIAAAITATDMTTLSEAARSLGASWWTLTWRVLLPNLRRGITAACFLTITVVLGEYTLASFLSRTTFQTALVLVQQTDPYVAAVFSLGALAFGFLLLVAIGRIGTRRHPKESA
ncbi:ABC transporter permease [Curtobacterium sp. ZW137]|uniref:ABC transporter permease n=1 Tax=Curtobacterium sp. ZW137 TaxID=2485104 RepID=UPI000F4CC19B|nr:ABC transporter permease subunit [Curtobacterium sp. ZW137]ROP58904.1 putative spermidine/putrescine transport system permease protein [Curtobacterium sp. ZW137]